MSRVRIIPTLLLDDVGLYKTINFKNPTYIGDPINTVQIFNTKEVDELIIIDFTARQNKRDINYNYIEEIVSEAFMPICYGGNINNINQCEKLFKLGVEKVSLNYSAIYNSNLISELAERFGSQSIVVSIDYKRNLFGKIKVYSQRGKKVVDTDIIRLAKQIEKLGAGEILLTSIDNEGKSEGYDIETIKKVSDSVNIPVIANGGCNDINDIYLAIKEGGASAVSASSMFIYWGKLRGVLINYPTQDLLTDKLFNKI